MGSNFDGAHHLKQGMSQDTYYTEKTKKNNPEIELREWYSNKIMGNVPILHGNALLYDKKMLSQMNH